MKLRKFLPYLVLLLCVPGVFLRTEHLLTGFDIGTALPITGNVWMYACIALFAAAAVLFFLMSLSLRQERGEMFETLLGTRSIGFRTAMALTGLLMIIGGLLYGYLTMTMTEEGAVIWSRALEFLYAGLTVLAGISMIGLGRLQNGDEVTKGQARLTLMPLLWSCIHLLVSYRLTCVDPKLPSFAFGLIADVLMVLAFYHLSRMLYGKPRPDFLAPLAGLATLLSVSDLGGYGVAWLMGMRALDWSAKTLVRGGLTVVSCIALMGELFLLSHTHEKH